MPLLNSFVLQQGQVYWQHLRASAIAWDNLRQLLYSGEEHSLPKGQLSWRPVFAQVEDHPAAPISSGEQKNWEEKIEQGLLKSLGAFREFREHNIRLQKAKDVLSVPPSIELGKRASFSLSYLNKLRSANLKYSPASSSFSWLCGQLLTATHRNRALEEGLPHYTSSHDSNQWNI